MVGGGMGGLFICFSLLAVASAGILHRYPRESEDYQSDLSVYANYTANEVCFSEGEVFQKGDVMPNPGPCEECRCEPPSIVCNMIKCPVNNNGCRTIQRANHCCPDYNCECDYNGQLYNDGERLDLPEEPCQVCYCKGGEVMCNSITCFHRDDCDPIQVPGQCCPKYENCPLRDMGSSSSDDKNVLVRSANKTNHISPKREMNPWLLTKLPPGSSSTLPKSSQDPTTEGGNIIIVSDWLTERRTTTEDSTSSEEERHYGFNLDSTDEPDLFTGKDHLTTVLKQDFSSDGGMVIKNSDIITPVDEVIFTRIDGLKQNQDVNVEGPTSIPSKVTQNELKTDITNGNSKSEPAELTTDISSNQHSVYPTIKGEDLKEFNPYVSLQEGKNSTKPHPMVIAVEVKQTEPPVETEKSNTSISSNVSTGTPTYFRGFNNISFESNSTNSNPETKNYSKETLEHLFGLELLSIGDIEKETTTKSNLGYTTENEETFTGINEFTGNSLEDVSKTEAKVNELKIKINESTPAQDAFSDTTANSLIDNDITTPFFTEVNVRKADLVSRNTEQENNSKEMSESNTSEIPTMKKDKIPGSNEREMEISLTTGYSTTSTKENNLFSGAETSKATTHPTSSNEIKIKRNNFNSSADIKSGHRKESLDLPLRSNLSTCPNKTEQTTVTVAGTINSHKEDNNCTNNVLINLDPLTIMNKDNSLTTLTYTNDKSDDGKELFSDTPPVLELNSHVPFLQLGGHGNLDSVINIFGEDTTVTSLQENNFNEKESIVVTKDAASSSILDSSLNDSLVPKHINATVTTVSPETTGHDQNNQTSQQEKKDNAENDQVENETTTDEIFTTSHIPLTPGDLKVLAEYLINDTIKTAPVKNVSDYIPNQWLKGNLTSEEKIASILTAANVSIAIMNKTDERAEKFITETATRVSVPIGIDKLEKEKLIYGNNGLNIVKIGNKTGLFQEKSDKSSDSPKMNSELEIPLDGESKVLVTTEKSNVETLNSNEQSHVQNTTINDKEMSKAKYQVSTNMPLNIKHTQFPWSTSQSLKDQSTSQSSDDNSLSLDNVNPIQKTNTNHFAKNDLSRNDKMSDFKTNSLTSTVLVTTSDPQNDSAP